MPGTTEHAAEATQHLYPLIGDLGLLLLAAAVATLLFKKLKQPLVLGYLIAGFLVGPYFTLFPTVQELDNVKVWAEIGVIILLFSLGLEFSFKKLMKVGGTAAITASVQIITMIFLGYFAGRIMGWSEMNSIFLGAMLSMSSTTIILRAFDELGEKSKKYAGIVFGALIIEDIVAILLMVLLSTIAVSQNFSGEALAMSVLKLGFFLILWFLCGIFFIPTFLKRARKLMNEETLLIVSLALCFTMVIIATEVGFSPALGAFIMGSILAETTQAEKIEHLIKPVKDLFGAVFFVSVGMMIEPLMLQKYALPIFIITLITIVGKTLSTTIGALMSGQPLKQSVQAGMSLAQIGEFSFIIATLGMSLGVMDEKLYPIVVAVSAVTTFTTPYMIKSSESMYRRLDKILPRRWAAALDRYSSGAQTIKGTSTWKKVLYSNLTQVTVHSVIIIGIILLTSSAIVPFLEIMWGDKLWINSIVAALTFIILSPFLWALSIRRIQPKLTATLWKDKLYRGPIFIMTLARVALGLIFIGLFLNNFFSYRIALIALAVVAIITFFLRNRIQKLYNIVEKKFLLNFNDREIAEEAEKNEGKELIPWDAHMAQFEIAPTSNIAGKSLVELGLRESLGINIAMIKRGDQIIRVPKRDERIFPKDIVYIIGTDEQIEAFSRYLSGTIVPIKEEEDNKSEVFLQQIVIESEAFVGKSIRESGLREKTKGLVVGLERKSNRILNPESYVVLEKGDIVWVVGDKRRIEVLLRNKAEWKAQQETEKKHLANQKDQFLSENPI